MHLTTMPLHLRRLLLGSSALTGIALASGAQAGQALPTGGVVTAGKATITQPNANQLTVTTGTQNTVIDWTSFSIANGNKVTIQQPGKSAITVNEVTGPDPSQIFGELSSNGRVVLANPNGIWFGPESHVDVAGLVASTATLSDASKKAFAAGGRLSLDQAGKATASIQNDGKITIAGTGLAALVAPGVRNNGVIQATLGSVELASGTTSTLDFYGDGLVALAVTNPVSAVAIGPDGKAFNATIENDGKIKSAQVLVTASVVKGVVDNVINMGGVTEAKGVTVSGGDIVLDGGDGNVAVTGSLDATSQQAKGGNVQVTGGAVTLASTSSIDVSGATGGGTVQVGGGPHGGGTLRHATTTTVQAGATIKANATKQGDGGNVAVWSDGLTTFNGSIEAKGAGTGNGGWVETSGHALSFVGGLVDTSAPVGKVGTWLLDPNDLTVDATAASTIDTNLATTNVTLQTTASGTSGPGNQNASGSGDIIIAAPISWSGGHALTLDAYHSVMINAPVSVNGGGSVVIITNDGGTGGDYGFGQAAGGFTGALTFASGQSGQGLTINGSSYTLLHSASDLQGINASSTTLGNATHYALANSIDLTGVTWTPIGTDGGTNVGNSGSGFAGTLTGLGHAVSNLNVAASVYVGLFGVATGATMRDMSLVGGSVSTMVAGNAPTGGNDLPTGNAGALVGQATNVTIANVYTNVPVSGASTSYDAILDLGGLVGVASGGTITNAQATGTVTGTATQSGTDAGFSIGGLVGSANAVNVADSSATGAVSLSVVSGYQTVGGLIGTAFSGYVSNSSATGSVSCLCLSDAVGGLVGSGGYGSVAITGSFANGAVSSSGAANGDNSGSSIEIGGLVGALGQGSINSSYARGKVSASSGATDATIDAGGLVGTGGNSITSSWATGPVSGSLTNSTDRGGIEIGGLVGFTTRNITNSHSSGAVSAYYAGVGSDYSGAWVGGLVGFTSGPITNSYETGAVSVSGTGPGNIGGLVGFTEVGSITSTFATGQVSATGSGVNNVGGFAGYAYNVSLTNVYATGSVLASGSNTDEVGGLIGSSSGGYVFTSFATGLVSAPSGTGGLIGTQALGSTTNAYWDAVTTGQSTSALGTSSTTTALQSALPAGFSSSVWGIIPGQSYPYLLSQFPTTPQVVSGTAQTMQSTAVAGGTVSLYSGGAQIGYTVSTGANGYYNILLPAGTLSTSSATVGGTLIPNGNSTIAAASAVDGVPLMFVAATGLNFTVGTIVESTTAFPLTAATPLATIFGATTYSAITAALPSVTPTISPAGVEDLSGTVSYDSLLPGVSILLTGDTTITASNENMNFTGTIDGAANLTLTATGGSITLAGAIGNTTPLNSLTLTASGITLANSVKSSGPVTLTSQNNISLTSGASIAATGLIEAAIGAGGTFTETAGASIRSTGTGGGVEIYNSSSGTGTIDIAGAIAAPQIYLLATNSSLSGSGGLVHLEPTADIDTANNSSSFDTILYAGPGGTIAIDGGPNMVLTSNNMALIADTLTIGTAATSSTIGGAYVLTIAPASNDGFLSAGMPLNGTASTALINGATPGNVPVLDIGVGSGTGAYSVSQATINALVGGNGGSQLNIGLQGDSQTTTFGGAINFPTTTVISAGNIAIPSGASITIPNSANDGDLLLTINQAKQAASALTIAAGSSINVPGQLGIKDYQAVSAPSTTLTVTLGGAITAGEIYYLANSSHDLSAPPANISVLGTANLQAIGIPDSVYDQQPYIYLQAGRGGSLTIADGAILNTGTGLLGLWADKLSIFGSPLLTAGMIYVDTGTDFFEAFSLTPDGNGNYIQQEPTISLGAATGTTPGLALSNATLMTLAAASGSIPVTIGDPYGAPVLVSVVGDVTLPSNTTITADAVTQSAGTTINAGSLTINTRTPTSIPSVSTTTANQDLPPNLPPPNINLAGTITTTGAQTYNGAVTLIGDSTLNSAGPIAFANTIDGTTSGAQSLAITSAATAQFGGAIGGTTALKNFSLIASGTVGSLPSIAVTGNQAIVLSSQPLDGSVTLPAFVDSNPIVLDGDATITVTGGNIDISGAVSGGHSLTLIDAAGTVTLTGAIGASTPLTSLAVTASHGIALGTAVTTSGAQTYSGPVSLVADTTLAGAGLALPGTIDGAYNLALNAGTGAVSLGAVGGQTALSSLTINAGAISLANVATTGAQSYSGTTTFNGTYSGASFTANGADLLGSATGVTVSNGNIGFASTLDGAQSLVLTDAKGTVTFSGAVGGQTPLGSLTVTAGGIVAGSIATTGAQTFTGPASFGGSYTANGFTTNGAVTLIGNTSVGGGTGDITFGSTVNGQFNLALASSNANIFFDGSAGSAGARLALLSVAGAANLSVLNNSSLYVHDFTATNVGGTLNFGNHSLESDDVVTIQANSVDGRVISTTSAMINATSVSGIVQGSSVTVTATGAVSEQVVADTANISGASISGSVDATRSATLSAGTDFSGTVNVTGGTATVSAATVTGSITSQGLADITATHSVSADITGGAVTIAAAGANVSGLITSTGAGPIVIVAANVTNTTIVAKNGGSISVTATGSITGSATGGQIDLSAPFINETIDAQSATIVSPNLTLSGTIAGVPIGGVDVTQIVLGATQQLASNADGDTATSDAADQTDDGTTDDKNANSKGPVYDFANQYIEKLIAGRAAHR